MLRSEWRLGVFLDHSPQQLVSDEVTRSLLNPLLSVIQWLLYRYSCVDDSAFERFLPRVWCLLRRYQV